VTRAASSLANTPTALLRLSVLVKSILKFERKSELLLFLTTVSTNIITVIERFNNISISHDTKTTITMI